jgi:hypothetical protein
MSHSDQSLVSRKRRQNTKENHMFKIVAALGVVLALVFTAVAKFDELLPTPVATAVIAEKSDGVIKGGQAAVLLPADLSTSQNQILNKAYEIAKADGHKNPEIVQGVLLQETQAGGNPAYKVAGNKGDEYFGVGQIKLGTAREVMSAYPKLWSQYKFQTKTDDELKANLILNSTFNTEITSKYLRILQLRYGLTGRDLVNAFNRGPGGVKSVGDDYHYAVGVEAKLVAFKARR